MKKINLFLICALMCLLSYSQEFIGIKPEGSLQEVVSKFGSKGFKITSQGNLNVTSMKGNYGGTEYEVNIVSTPTSKKVWKIAVYLPEQTSWYSLKSTYLNYLKTLSEKYGEPSKSYNFFSSPYYEGDGYEMSAVLLEKCHYAAYWETLIMSIDITKWKQVRICYENKTNSDLYDKEKESINKNIF